MPPDRFSYYLRVRYGECELADPDYLFDEGRDERYEDDDIAETDLFNDVVASGDG